MGDEPYGCPLPWARIVAGFVTPLTNRNIKRTSLPVPLPRPGQRRWSLPRRAKRRGTTGAVPVLPCGFKTEPPRKRRHPSPQRSRAVAIDRTSCSGQHGRRPAGASLPRSGKPQPTPPPAGQAAARARSTLPSRKRRTRARPAGRDQSLRRRSARHRHCCGWRSNRGRWCAPDRPASAHPPAPAPAASPPDRR